MLAHTIPLSGTADMLGAHDVESSSRTGSSPRSASLSTNLRSLKEQGLHFRRWERHPPLMAFAEPGHHQLQHQDSSVVRDWEEYPHMKLKQM